MGKLIIDISQRQRSIYTKNKKSNKWQEVMEIYASHILNCHNIEKNPFPTLVVTVAIGECFVWNDSPKCESLVPTLDNCNPLKIHVGQCKLTLKFRIYL